MQRPGIIPADSFGSSAAQSYLSVWPPEPDTTTMVIGNCQKIGKIEVVYYTSIPLQPDNLAYIVDAENKIIDSTSAVSGDKPVSSIYGRFYPTKAVFHLNKSVKSPVVKITIPNKPAFPDGHEIFYIKFD